MLKCYILCGDRRVELWCIQLRHPPEVTVEGDIRVAHLDLPDF